MEFREMMLEGLRASERSVSDLAREVGVARSTLARTVYESVNMSETHLRAYAAVTGLDGDDLVIASGKASKPGPRARIAELLEENRRLVKENQALRSGSGAGWRE